ncbi:MAG TPA: hypothetical protein VGB77_02735 [Abditibacteriaceae bacterium]
MKVFVRLGNLLWTIGEYELHYGGTVCCAGNQPFRHGPLPNALVIVLP